MGDASSLSIDSNPPGTDTMSTTTALVFITTAIVVFYIFNKLRGQERWEKYGVKQASYSLKELPTLLNQRLMKEYGNTVGIMRGSPVLITRDLDLLKRILVKDFNNFVDRNDKFPTLSPLGKGLFFLGGHDWKRIRQLMSPSFSTGKLKHISAHVYEAARSLAKVFENCARSDTHIKLLHTTGQYTTSIIAKTAFGLQADCIGEEEDDEFTYSAKNIVKRRNKWTLLIVLFVGRFRTLRAFLLEYFNFSVFDPCPKETSQYFSSVLEDSIKEREAAELSGGTRRNDFLQSLVSTKLATDAAAVRQPMEGVDAGQSAVNKTSKRITKEEVIGQSVLTILAAFETTASTLQFCLYMLAKHPDIQDKVYAEIKEQILKHSKVNGSESNPSHEELSRLRYTEQVINETLRLFPPLTSITRKAINNYRYENITIPAEAAVSVPIREIHRDPANFPDPETFDPDRFSDEAKATRHPLAFMPFGQGPRLCIGMRLAYLELKAGLFFVLSKVKVELNETTVPTKEQDIKVTFVGFPRPEIDVKLAVKLREDERS